jgi:Tannase and feruloyl esterase
VYRCAFALCSSLLLISGASGQKAATPSSCAALASLSLPDTKIVLAQQVEAGKFSPPEPSQDPAGKAAYQDLPAFCRIVARSAPTPDSDIKIEVWMPVKGWNGRFRGAGNGGFAGQIYYSSLAASVSQGYATAATDAGHSGDSTEASWALGHPEKVNDFGYRAIHEMTQKARSIISAYYGTAPTHSYFLACSDGGREALMEAQRFPEDYDGILAGAPAYNWTALLTGAVTGVQALTLTPASYIPPSKLPAISSAVLAACGASDRVRDGILNDPRTCHFDPEVLLCKGTDSDHCLTSSQVTALKSLYAGARNGRGEQVYPGLLPGAELGAGGWKLWITGSKPGDSLMFAFGTGYFSNMVYGDPKWDYKSFNVDDGLKAAVEKTATALNATDPNLKPFSSRGGKLILYHGWNDAAISALGTIAYYQQVASSNSDPQSFVRLFLVPGMQHCSGGPGPSSFGQFGWHPGTGPDDTQHDISLALEQWVEKGVAPEKVIAAKIEADPKAAPHTTMTRPLCAYPQEARYNGSGDTSDAASFACALPAK